VYEITEVTARVTHTDTRIPFRYGIAEMTRAPHAVIEVRVTNGRHTTSGFAAEQLPPKWFTKDPQSAFRDDLRDMVAVIDNAVSIAIGLRGSNSFAIWRELDEAQSDWGRAHNVPGLLSGLGTALVERAMIDAVCRLAETPFAAALGSGLLGFDATAVHEELRGSTFAPQTAARLHVRHTIGLGDPLTDAEAGASPDTLPASLESSIRRYGLTHLKIKTRADAAEDAERLLRILAITRERGIEARFTIDGNESMTRAEDLTHWWETLAADVELRAWFARGLIAIEQPFARGVALEPAVGDAVRALPAGVRVIIDESDDAVATVRKAMDLGYAGGTYKGCKGVFRGVANAALIAERGRTGSTILTAEDLATLGPITVAQDIAVAATLGLTHIERNGHHYFGRQADLGDDLTDRLAAMHPDLYAHQDGDVRLIIAEGAVSTRSALAAPFGLAPLPRPDALPALTVETATRGID
jgi:L-alanine-DL-glutamate epimerase-like enolase superfamily enzyme